MKQLFIKDLKKGDSIFGETFAVKNYKKAATRTNRPYIDIELADNTGSMKGKIWSDDMAKCKETKIGEIVLVEGQVQDFDGKFQMKISKMEAVNDYDEADYIQKTEYDTKDLYKEILDTAALVKNIHLKKLLDLIFGDKEFAESFMNASGAYRVHHAYSGGLLEHTAEVIEVAKSLLKRFPKANSDLVFTGAILHDLGKVFEYTVTSTITTSKTGKLLGHIFIGTEYVKNKASEIKDMPEDLLEELLHIMLSHHGEIAYGSPVKPMTAEALIVWVSDDASSKVNMGYNTIHNSGLTNEFTSYHPQLGTELYVSPYLNTSEDGTLF